MSALALVGIALRNPKPRVERDPRFGRKLTPVEQDMQYFALSGPLKQDRKRADSDAARKGQK